MHATRKSPSFSFTSATKSGKFTKPVPAPLAPTFPSTNRFSLANTASTFLGRLRDAFGITLAEAAVQAVGDPEVLPTFREAVEPFIERGREVIQVEARKGAIPVALMVGVGVLALVGVIAFTGRRPAPARG